MAIEPKFLKFGDLVGSRLFRIPEYQRAYSWEKKHRRDLFDDILALRKREDTSHFMATMVGLKREKKTIVTDEFDVVQVVDGQQRLTTLVILVKALEKAMRSSGLEASTEARLSVELSELLVKPDNVSLLLLQTNHDTSSYFIGYLREGETARPSEAKTLADRAILSAIGECEAFVKDWPGGDLIELTAIIKNRLTFIFHEIESEALVYTVFEVLNSRGLEVAWLDRLKSALMAVAFEYLGDSAEAIDELHLIWKDIYRTIGLRQTIRGETLKFAATLRSEKQPSRVLGDEQSVEVLRSQCGNDAKKAIEISRWILDVAKAVDSFYETGSRRQAVTKIAHARFLAVAILLGGGTSSAREQLLRFWERISFRIFGLCRKDARSKVGSFVRLAWDCYQGVVSFEEVGTSLRDIGSTEEVTIEWALESVKAEDCYTDWVEELRYLLFRYEEHLARETGTKIASEQWSRLWAESAAKSIEHILPVSLGSDVKTEGKVFVHSLGNLMLLPPGQNSSLGKREPIDKVEAYRGSGLNMAIEVANRITSAGGWTTKEIQEREKDLLSFVKSEWGTLGADE